MSSSESESVAANVAQWTKANADHTDAAAARQWAADEISWGVFGVPEADVDCLGDVDGIDVVELGCGNGDKLATLLRQAGVPGVHAHLVDLSEAALARSLPALAAIEEPGVRATTHQATYEEGLLALPGDDAPPTLVVFLGSGIAGAIIGQVWDPLPGWFTTTMLALNIAVGGTIVFTLLAVFANQRRDALAALRVEQAKAESLLLNILPRPIAEKLKAESQPIADQFESYA